MREDILEIFTIIALEDILTELARSLSSSSDAHYSVSSSQTQHFPLDQPPSQASFINIDDDEANSLMDDQSFDDLNVFQGRLVATQATNDCCFSDDLFNPST